MLAMEIQDRLDAIVHDLQFAGKGKTVQLMFRDASNQPHILPLSSNAAGVVDAAQLTAVQTFVNGLKTAADTYLHLIRRKLRSWRRFAIRLHIKMPELFLPI